MLTIDHRKPTLSNSARLPWRRRGRRLVPYVGGTNVLAIYHRAAPAIVYLAGNASEVGCRGPRRSLNRTAEIFTGGLATSALVVDRTEARYQHVAALRELLIDDDSKPATINPVLSPVRGTIKKALRLGFINAETKERVADVSSVGANTLPAGQPCRRWRSHRAVPRLQRRARGCSRRRPTRGCGLRRSEAVALLLDDYDDDGRSLSKAARDVRTGSCSVPPAGATQSKPGSLAAVPGRPRCFNQCAKAAGSSGEQ